MKQKVGNGRGGGSDLDLSDPVVKKIKWEKERKRKWKRATQLRLDHLWSRSPSHGGKGRSRSPEHGGERLVGFRSLGFLWKVLGSSSSYLLVLSTMTSKS